MKLIFCLDKNNGMMFGGKRQSQDEKLRQWILSNLGEGNLWMSSYSARQFGDHPKIVADDRYLPKAAANDYCFIEDKEFSIEGVDEVILCKWNRKYPGDRFFNIDLQAEGFKKITTVDIAGNSHEKITIEMYKRE